MFTKTFVASLLASAASGHMLMNTPAPYSSPALVNSPLNADGSNFPCQLTSGGSLSGGTASSYALGSEQSLKFTGQAVHGGGSCQVSLTYDTNPSKTSTWKVIRSIEGGCPAQDQVGNMGNDANVADPYTYNFTVPDNIPTGSVTLAWTWFNKVGNREMYMNCAPVTLTGTSGSQSNFDSLPDMFTANIGDSCTTVAEMDVEFPNPGQDVIRLNGATSAFAAPTGSGCQVAGSSGSSSGSSGSGSGSGSGSSSSSSTKAAAPATTSTTAAAAETTGIAGGVFVTTGPADVSASTPATSSPAAVATTATTAAVGTVATAATSAAAAATSASSSSGSGSSSSSSGTQQTAGAACSPEGTWNCMGSSYQICASGTWSVVMQMAAGTECTVGSTTMDVKAVSSKARRVPLRFRA